jgi:hypothetical protein
VTLTTLGLDLGQRSDYSALAAVECNGTEVRLTTQGEDPEYHVARPIEHVLIGPPVSFRCRHLQRWPLGTSYPRIVADVGQLARRLSPPPILGIDLGGVGIAVGNLFTLAGLPHVGVTITAGRQPNATDLGFTVPKRELVGAVQVALQAERLRIAKALPEAETLVHELEVFDGKLSESGYETLEARSGQHDDLLLALCLACWVGERAILETFEQARADLEAAAFTAWANGQTQVKIGSW